MTGRRVLTPGHPVLTLVQPAPEPGHRHGPRWWWFRITEAYETARWHVVTTLAAVVAMVVPRVRGEAWAEGFDVALGNRPARTWRHVLGAWRQGNELAHEIVHRGVGEQWDGGRLIPSRPFAVPDPAALADIAADVAAEQLAYSGAARAEAAFEQARQAADTAGGRWRELHRIPAAVAVMATAAVAADSQRVTALAPLVAGRRVVVIDGRHAAPPGHPGRRRGDGPRTAPRHARPRWRTAVARWLRGGPGGAHRYGRGPLRAAA